MLKEWDFLFSSKWRSLRQRCVCVLPCCPYSCARCAGSTRLGRVSAWLRHTAVVLLAPWEVGRRALKVVVILKVVSAQDTERVSWVRSLVSSPTGLERSPTEAQDCVAVHYYTLHFHCMLFWFVFFFLTYSKILSLIKIWKSKNTDLVVVFSNVLYKCYF